ncbi:MAG: haloacid dehalogenase type II [Pseudomonadota bacterium]
MTKPAAFVFDAYGTLFDVHSAAQRHAADIGDNWGRLSDVWRTKQLEYTWVLAAAGQHDTFWAITERALDYAIAATDASVSKSLRSDLLSAYRTLQAYPEVADVLAQLREGGARTLILSNGDVAMLAEAVSAAGLDGLLDGVLSVASVGVFKPDMSVYQSACNATGLEASAISFQSSNRWDIAGAHVFGFRTVWINRTSRPNEYPAQPPDAVLPDLHGLVDA